MYAQAEPQSGEQKCPPLSLTPQKARGCIQRKGFRQTIEFIRQDHIQTQNSIFKAQIYSFLFQPFVKSLRKYPQSLEISAFCAISCKIVISDKW
jgi:hypothetical protein